jgi:hypothetical protein
MTLCPVSTSECTVDEFRSADPVPPDFTRDGQRPIQGPLWLADNGKGLESSVQSTGRRPRHFGLQGMRERAQKMGGVFNLWTKDRAGIEIEVVVPAGVAYEEEHTRFFRSISKRFALRWRR